MNVPIASAQNCRGSPEPCNIAWVPLVAMPFNEGECDKTVPRVLFLTRVKSDKQLRVRRELYKFRMQTQDGDH